MTRHRNLSILSAAGLTTALAIGTLGVSAAAAEPSMGGHRGLEAPDVAIEAGAVLLSGEGEGMEEESGAQYGADATYDETVAGARLLLAYDPESNSFGGLVENTTDAVLDQVHVEVYLSNGTELGPTEPVDLAPGEVIEVVLPATDEPFDTFSAHPEVGIEHEDDAYESEDHEDADDGYEDEDDD